MHGISKFAVQEWLSKGAYEVIAQSLQKILKPDADDVLLDVGGGTGRLAGYFAGKCREVWVLDPEQRKLQFGKERRKNVHFIRASADPIPFADGYFSKAIAIASFHHIQNQDASLQEIKRVLKSDGQLVMLEFDPSTLRGKINNFFENRLRGMNYRFCGPAVLAEKLGRYGYQVKIERAPVGYFLSAINNGNSVPQGEFSQTQPK